MYLSPSPLDCINYSHAQMTLTFFGRFKMIRLLTVMHLEDLRYQI